MALFTGTLGPDFIVGGDENDVILGLPGNDSLFGAGGNDRVFGQRGDDLLFGGQGNDLVSGGAGNDRLAGGFGEDRVFGGTGDDIMSGGAQDDRFIFTEADCEDVASPAPTASGVYPPPPPPPVTYDLQLLDIIADFQGVGDPAATPVSFDPTDPPVPTPTGTEQDVIDLRRLRDVSFEDIEFTQQGDNTIITIECGDDCDPCDRDGDGDEALVIAVLDTNANEWTAQDFLFA